MSDNEAALGDALQIEHHLSQLPRGHRHPFTPMVDFPTLAELAEKIAPRNKNRSGPSLPGQRRLLPEMGKGGCHPQLVASVAEAELAAAAQHPTIPRTQGARAHEPLQGGKALLQLACPIQICI